MGGAFSSFSRTPAPAPAFSAQEEGKAAGNQEAQALLVGRGAKDGGSPDPGKWLLKWLLGAAFLLAIVAAAFLALGPGADVPASRSTCLAEVESDWRSLGLVITKEKSNQRAYVACDHSLDNQRKVSCRTEDCGGAPWCYVQAHCGAWYRPCGRSKDLALDCQVMPLDASRALGWSFRTGFKPATSPGSRAAIVAAVNQSDPPLPAAEGWSWFIGHRKPDQKLLALRDNWSGLIRRMDHKVVRVRSGTTFGALKKYLTKKGRAVHDRPQYDELSIGGAVRTVGHGWSGTRFFTESITALEGVERGTGKTIKVAKGSANFWKTMFDESVVILNVDLETVQNRRICVSQLVESHPGAHGRLVERSKGALFRQPFFMLFVSASNALYRSATYYDGGDGDQSCWKRASDQPVGSFTRLIRTIRRHLEIPEEFAINQTIGASHTLIDTSGITGQIVTLVRGTYNFELFSTEQPDLDKAIPAMAEFHEQWGGRTEYRARARGGTFVAAIDVIMKPGEEPADGGTPHGIAAWLDMAHKRLGITRAYVHAGKYIPPSLGPIEAVGPADFWAGVEAKASGQGSSGGEKEEAVE